MKSILKRVCAGIMALVMLVCLFPVSALALSAQEQEDFYRVNTWWQDEPSASTSLSPDVAARPGWMIVLNLNGVLLKSCSTIPDALQCLEEKYLPHVAYVKKDVICLVRPDDEARCRAAHPTT